MVYCMSDIHGEHERFKKMLQTIQFSDGDHLYIIGDAIDRGALGVDILTDIMAAPNMTMLLGNHEAMCIATLGSKNEFGARDLWKQNGGAGTYRELLYHRSSEERHKIIRFLEKLPDHLEIEVNGHVFHLVHGIAADNREDRIWERPKAGTATPLEGKTVIVGHTPTPYITGDFENVYKIWHGNGIIDIDCGCGNETELRRLACLRLDDMAEFYV